MMTPFIGALFASSLVGLAATTSDAVTSTDVFESSTQIAGKNGALQRVQITVRQWRFSRQGNTPQELPLEGFYVAHLLSGAASTVENGVVTPHIAGDYWTVKAGEKLQVKVLGDLAVIETIVVKKQ